MKLPDVPSPLLSMAKKDLKAAKVLALSDEPFDWQDAYNQVQSLILNVEGKIQGAAS